MERDKFVDVFISVACISVFGSFFIYLLVAIWKHIVALVCS